MAQFYFKVTLISYKAQGEGEWSFNSETGWANQSTSETKITSQLELSTPESEEKIPMNVQSVIKVKMQIKRSENLGILSSPRYFSNAFLTNHYEQLDIASMLELLS